MNRQDQYIEEYSSTGTEADTALLAELERETGLRVVHSQMVSGSAQGAFLTLMTKILRPKLVLEIGTFTGYSALSIAAGLDQDAEIHTIEINDELEDICRSFFERSPHGHKIHLHTGSALEVVPELANRLGCPFDMVFIDGDKREYLSYYQMLMGGNCSAVQKNRTCADSNTVVSHPSSAGNEVLPMVRPGTIILADNVLWYGKVVDQESWQESDISFSATSSRQFSEAKTGGNNSEKPPAHRGSKSSESIDKHTAGIMEFNRIVSADPRVENVILPLRDGINLIRVK